jgi:hypothetical protein
VWRSSTSIVEFAMSNEDMLRATLVQIGFTATDEEIGAMMEEAFTHVEEFRTIDKEQLRQIGFKYSSINRFLQDRDVFFGGHAVVAPVPGGQVYSHIVPAPVGSVLSNAAPPVGIGACSGVGAADVEAKRPWTDLRRGDFEVNYRGGQFVVGPLKDRTAVKGRMSKMNSTLHTGENGMYNNRTIHNCIIVCYCMVVLSYNTRTIHNCIVVYYFTVVLFQITLHYVALSACAQFGKWFKGLVADMGLELAHYRPIVILSDFASAITIVLFSSFPLYIRHLQYKEHMHWTALKEEYSRSTFLLETEYHSVPFTTPVQNEEGAQAGYKLW